VNVPFGHRKIIIFSKESTIPKHHQLVPSGSDTVQNAK
jgi:hypothetical protein